MDFGVLGLQPVGHPPPHSSPEQEPTLPSSALDSRQNVGSNLGSALAAAQDVVWKPSKIPRTSGDGDGDVDFSVPSKKMPPSSLLRSNSTSTSTEHNNMLCFSSAPAYYPAYPAYARVAPATMHGAAAAFAGVRGPFTPSQWMELEHQALIYKYITANVAVPSNLLNPLKKSPYPFALSCSSAVNFAPGALGWGGFHLGYPGSTNDPEPGRCRRTDGKKWRCSRDAVADQKYCERHINRGRHRSRKPVEGQSGRGGVAGTKVVVPPPPMATSTSAITTNTAASAAAGCIGVVRQQQQQTSSTLPAANGNRFVVGQVSDNNSNCRLQAASSLMTVANEESPRSEFGLVSFDSLLNPSQDRTTGNCYNSFLSFDQDAQDQHSLHQFMDNDWSKDQSTRSVITWPEELKSDWTQLSMSIPMTTTSNFSSSSSSPAHEKSALSPLRLSREFDSTYMAQGGVAGDDANEKQTASWMTIPWGGGAPMMGCSPLGEVLTTSTSGNVGCWDGGGPPQMGLSPTGVLQKVSFGSLSNSSSGSSPRAERKRNSNGSNNGASTISVMNDEGSACLLLAKK